MNFVDRLHLNICQVYYEHGRWWTFNNTTHSKFKRVTYQHIKDNIISLDLYKFILLAGFEFELRTINE